MSSNRLLIFIFIIGFITRFIGLNWGNGYFFHPDENNMAAAVSQFTPNNLHPHFFAYGQFPLYLGYFTLKVIDFPNSFSASVYVLRFWSAIFSVLSLYFLYKIYPSRLFLLLLIFTPGLIQLAHFGTTESLLVLVFAINLYLAIRHPQQVFLAALVSGIGIASKVSAAVFILPIILANWKNVKHILAFLPLTLLFSALFSPYNVLALPEFLSTLRYETAVAIGSLSVFYTRQFINTTPYLFQIQKIFPYIAGSPIFILSVFSVFLIRKSSVFYHKSIIIGLPCLIYFLYFGQTYVKWTRFMSPLFFIFPLGAAILLNHIRPILKWPLLLVSLLPGLFFLRLYFIPDIRLSASNWINFNLPQSSAILSEAGNVINIPLNSSSFNITNFDFYGLDSSIDLQSELPAFIDRSDFILIPSRRIFKNQSNLLFPYSQKYYQALFSGQLGFQHLKTFTPTNWLFLNPENAEETWSVFDHPTIRLYQKTEYFNQSYYDQLFFQT